MKTSSKLYFITAIALFLFVFCNRDEKNINKQNVAENVPLIFKEANDLNFKYQQDTLFYRNKRFSGHQYLLYPNGDTAFVKPFLAGLEEGMIRKWYPNQQLLEERYYIGGRKEKTHKAWWPNGKLKFIYEFDNDEFNGVNKEWYENGILFKEFHYENGHESGSQKMYWSNGKTRANYVIKNNRRYGLLGTKNCINVADSLFIKR